LVPANIERLITQLDVPADEVRAYAAVREAAAARLLANASLADDLGEVVTSYARSLSLPAQPYEGTDLTTLPRQAVLRQPLGRGLVEPRPDIRDMAYEVAALRLALANGWVSAVTTQAVAPHLTHAAALREMWARRRATNGAPDDFFGLIMGLPAQPHLLRQYADLLHEIGGDNPAKRDIMWTYEPATDDTDDTEAQMEKQVAAFLQAMREAPRPDEPGTPG
jgi:uncharacterized protein (DUF2342 family)